MDWKEYEEITKYVYETLGNAAGTKIVGHGRTCKVEGKSGVSHQIDILTSHSDGVHNYRTAIECKYWDKKINKEIVMKIAEIIEDSGINKGVVVSKMGFTEDAISFAEYKNVGLVELREMEKRDWQDQLTKPSFQVALVSITTAITLRRPEISSIIIHRINDNPIKINPRHMAVRHNSGYEVSIDQYFGAFKKLLHDQEPEKILEKYYELKDAILINRTTKEETPISGFTLLGKLTVRNDDVKREIEIVDEVWLTMKILFEGNSFSVLKSGLIKKDE
ncbi:MAG: restriction endonuclease [Saprospiraceae bacterium]|nr:restriction endonuclease [Saprospiraceae bacterium]MBK8655372.1 restriction endonuclease [Haliscomenobacter sp.]